MPNSLLSPSGVMTNLDSVGMNHLISAHVETVLEEDVAMLKEQWGSYLLKWLIWLEKKPCYPVIVIIYLCFLTPRKKNQTNFYCKICIFNCKRR